MTTEAQSPDSQLEAFGISRDHVLEAEAESNKESCPSDITVSKKSPDSLAYFNDLFFTLSGNTIPAEKKLTPSIDAYSAYMSNTPTRVLTSFSLDNYDNEVKALRHNLTHLHGNVYALTVAESVLKKIAQDDTPGIREIDLTKINMLLKQGNFFDVATQVESGKLSIPDAITQLDLTNLSESDFQSSTPNHLLCRHPVSSASVFNSWKEQVSGLTTFPTELSRDLYSVSNELLENNLNNINDYKTLILCNQVLSRIAQVSNGGDRTVALIKFNTVLMNGDFVNAINAVSQPEPTANH